MESRSRLTWGLVAAAVVTGLVGLVGGLAVSRLSDSADAVAHTNEVLSRVEALAADLQLAETAQRGMLLTADSKFREEFGQARRRIGSDLDELRRLTADNPRQQPRLDAAGVLIGERFKIADRVLALRRIGGPAAHASALDPREGAETMGFVLAQIEGMREEERRLLVERSARVKSEGRRAVILLACRAVAALFVVFAAGLLARDFTTRLALKEEVKNFFELSADPLCIADFDGRFVRLNDAWSGLLGYPLHEILGRRFADLVHPDDHERTAAETARLAAGGTPKVFENRCRCRDGSYRRLRWLAASSAQTQRLYAVARDVTAEHELETIRREVGHHVSHELTNPAAAVTLALDMLMDAEEAPAAKRRVIVEIARGSVRHLVRMIEDLLLVSSSETGKMKVVVEPLDLSAQIAAIVEAQRPAAAARGAAIELSAPAGLWGRADPTRLRQVLANLIDNALKFTPAGGRVRVTASVSARDKGFVAVSVSDEGPGIPEPERERVFERHFQSSAGVEKGGLGLGLAICRELVTRQGGRIWADAGERGAVLTFTLPAA